MLGVCNLWSSIITAILFYFFLNQFMNFEDLIWFGFRMGLVISEFAIILIFVLGVIMANILKEELSKI